MHRCSPFWVSDYNDKNWIDARKARYIRVMHSPMGYGLGAVASADQGAIDFAEAVRHIHSVETNEHRHGKPRLDYEQPGQGE